MLSQSFYWFVSFQSKSEEGEQQDKKFENCEMRMEGLEVIAVSCVGLPKILPNAPKIIPTPWKEKYLVVLG